MYKTTRNVLVLATGFSRGAHQPIGAGEIQDDKLWKAWIDSGIVENVPDKPAEPQVSKKEEGVPLPKPGTPLLIADDEPSGDPQLRDLPEEELRAMGKRLKLTSLHLMKKETLIRKLEELS